MPYCCQCGEEARSQDRFCGVCGASQPGARCDVGDYFSSLTPRTASLLCYIPMLGWIPAIIVLASARFRHNREVRFHAFQGLYLFVAWLIVDWVLAPVVSFPMLHSRHSMPFGGLLKGAVLAVWIFMLIRVGQDRPCKLPIIGELAERSVAEQK